MRRITPGGEGGEGQEMPEKGRKTTAGRCVILSGRDKMSQRGQRLPTRLAAKTMTCGWHPTCKALAGYNAHAVCVPHWNGGAPAPL
jgi:hypothetical protein